MLTREIVKSFSTCRTIRTDIELQPRRQFKHHLASETLASNAEIFAVLQQVQRHIGGFAIART